MNLSLILVKKIAELSVVILLGFLTVRLKVMDSADSKPLSQFALAILTPCAMLNAYQYDFSMERLSGMALSFLASLAVAASFGILTALLRKPLKLSLVEQTSLEYPNAGNFMLPIVAAALGGEWVIYLSACFFVMNIFMFSHGKAVLSNEKKIHFSMFYKNTIMLANLLGFIMFIFHIRLPGIIGQTVGTLGNMMGPVYMFTIGMILGNADLKSVFLNQRAWMITLGRLVIYPIVAVLILRLFLFFTIHPMKYEVISIAVMTAAAPAAVMVTQFTQLYRSHEEAEYSSAINIMSTVLCLFTMPMVAGFYEFLL